MQIPVVRALCQNFNLQQLREAETCLCDEKPLPFEVGGEDEGEQLSHILGALWILEQVEQGTPFNDALRAFTQRVRNSIQS